MKAKLISLIALALMSVMTLSAQVSFGVKAGVNFQNITGKDYNGKKLDNGLVPGFHIGGIADIPIAPDFYFQPGLLLSTKGTNYEIIVTKASGDYDAGIRLAYVELPMNVVFKPQLGNGHIVLGFGPYVAYGVKGKVKSLNSDEEVDIKFKGTVPADASTDYMYLKGFDAGANIFFGYELPVGLFFQLNTQLGMLSMIPDYEGVDTSDSESAMKNTGFGLSVGFKF